MDHKSAGFISNLTACTCVQNKTMSCFPTPPNTTTLHCFQLPPSPANRAQAFFSFLLSKKHTPTLPLSTVSYSFSCKSLPECTVFSYLLLQPMRDKDSFCAVPIGAPSHSAFFSPAVKNGTLPLLTKVRAKTNRRGATTFLRFIFLLNKRCYYIIFSSMADDRARPYFQQKF